jgi:hypothetical protein
MATVYQLMIGKKQIGDLYYNEDDAINGAMQIAIDSGCGVVIREAEEIEDTPYDELEWNTLRVVFGMRVME